MRCQTVRERRKIKRESKRERERERERQTQREIHTHTDTQRGKTVRAKENYPVKHYNHWRKQKARLS